MPVACEHRPLGTAGAQQRAVPGLAENRVRASSDESKRKNVSLTKQRQARKPAKELPESTVRNSVSVDTVCSTDSSRSGSSVKTGKPSRTTKRVGAKPAKLDRNAPGAEAGEASSKPPGPLKRCDWITPNSGECGI